MARLRDSLIGVGLRSPHHHEVLTQQPDIGWLEIHSENFFNPHTLAKQQLLAIAEHYPISCHGVGLSIGSADPLDAKHLARLKALVDELNPIAVSEHLSWSSVDGQYFNDLLPLPYTEQALIHFCDKVKQVQDVLGRQLLIENPSSYLSFAHSTIPEWEFLAEVERRAECGLLLDLNNIFVSSFNHGFDCATYLAAIDPASVKEIHLAGFTKKQTEHGEVWIDTHSQPVSDKVWHLYRQWVNQHGPIATLIEWDLELPPFATLLAEAHKAHAIAYKESRHVAS